MPALVFVLITGTLLSRPATADYTDVDSGTLLLFSRQCLNNGDCLWDKREDCQNCYFCIVHSDNAHIIMYEKFLQLTVGLACRPGDPENFLKNCMEKADLDFPKSLPSETRLWGFNTGITSVLDDL